MDYCRVSQGERNWIGFFDPKNPDTDEYLCKLKLNRNVTLDEIHELRKDINAYLDAIASNLSIMEEQP